MTELISPGKARTARKVAFLTEIARLYSEYRAAGSLTPALDIAARLDADRSTVRSWIYRARAEGLLVDSEHQPRSVDWGARSWKACTACRVEWPCAGTAAEAKNPEVFASTAAELSLLRAEVDRLRTALTDREATR